MPIDEQDVNFQSRGGITTTGANVYTSALFYDFLLSRPGMETIRASRRIPTRPDVTARYLKPYKLMPFEQSAMDEFDKYVAPFRETSGRDSEGA